MWWCYANNWQEKNNMYAKQKICSTLERNLQKISLRQKYKRINKIKKILRTVRCSKKYRGEPKCPTNKE
jgi:hypothetical protein